MKLKIVFIVAVLYVINGSYALQAKEHGTNYKGEVTLKILTIGNSFADNASTFLPQIAESVPGYKIEITKANIGGSSLEKHAELILECENNPGLKPYSNEYCLKELLGMEDYDYITIQQVSSSSWRSESFQPHADVLIEFIRKHSPNSVIVIHQTWAYHPDSNRLTEWGITSSEMHKNLVQNYRNLAGDYNLEVIRSGEAFYKAFEKKNDLNLWNDDRYHANNNGCYLAGCVWFGQLFDVSPTSIKYVPEQMDRKTAKYLKRIAKQVIER